MNRHNIPTATYQIFRDYEKARAYIDEVSHDVVIKASGLAGGKGVIIPSSKAEAHEALRQVMLDHSFGEAGDEVVVEEFLGGDELSIITFSDGYTIRSLPPAQDHKRALDGDTGPNTGGMGCYAPTRIADEETREAIDRTVVQPTIDGMRKDGKSGAQLKRILTNARRVLSFLTRFPRDPLGWYTVHGSDDDAIRSKGPRVQC